jgi:FlaA1/EpsC-like NDP-sugar epimerase
MAERLMSAANNNRYRDGPVFASTRFGNVMGSRGSVIPIFHQQIRRGGPVTLTHSEMTRFIMSIEEAVRLVVDSALLACGGEVFVTKMKVIRIKDLAEVMIDDLSPKYGYEPENIEIRTIGTKPGEKMYEELMNQEETRRSWELKKYFVVIPAFGGTHGKIKYSYDDIMSMKISAAYHSGNIKPLTKKALLQFIKDNKLIESDTFFREHPAERYWPNGN